MKVETTIKVTLTEEELNAIKIVHNMLAHLSVSDTMHLNNELPEHIHLDNMQDGLAIIYELATDGDMSELDR